MNESQWPDVEDEEENRVIATQSFSLAQAGSLASKHTNNIPSMISESELKDLEHSQYRR